jgi:hypothetical protein
MRYMVHWAIDIDTGTPEEAAQRALEIQRDAGSTATVFTVTAADGSTVHEVDLSEDTSRVLYEA